MTCRPRNPMYYDHTCAEHIGSPLTDDGRCQEARMIAAEAQVQAVRWLAQGYADVARMDSDATVPLALVAAQVAAALDGAV